MTVARATKRRTSLEKHSESVIADFMDGLTQTQIAQKYKVHASSVMKFRQRHTDKLTELSLAVERQVEDFAIARKVSRIEALNDRWIKAKQVIAERAAAAYDAPGASTGLVTHTYKGVGSGAAATVVDDYAVDTGLLNEIRALEHAAAEELGQLPRASDVSVTNNHLTLIRQYNSDTDSI